MKDPLPHDGGQVEFAADLFHPPDEEIAVCAVRSHDDVVAEAHVVQRTQHLHLRREPVVLGGRVRGRGGMIVREHDAVRLARGKKRGDLLGGDGGSVRKRAREPLARMHALMRVQAENFDDFLFKGGIALQKIGGEVPRAERRGRSLLGRRDAFAQDADAAQIGSRLRTDAVHREQLLVTCAKELFERGERVEQRVRERVGVLARDGVIQQDLQYFVIL
mgnify:CR=1 FL=1